MKKVTLTETQWEMVTEALLDTQDKSLIYIAKDIQMQIAEHDMLHDWKEHLRRNGLNV